MGRMGPKQLEINHRSLWSQMSHLSQMSHYQRGRAPGGRPLPLEGKSRRRDGVIAPYRLGKKSERTRAVRMHETRPKPPTMNGWIWAMKVGSEVESEVEVEMAAFKPKQTT